MFDFRHGEQHARQPRTLSRFFERFKSFWATPNDPRVAEIIAPDAIIHFTGAGTFSGADYIDIMAGMLASKVDMTVTPLDCVGNGDRLYIAWETTAVINGKRTAYLGVDRFLNRQRYGD